MISSKGQLQMTMSLIIWGVMLGPTPTPWYCCDDPKIDAMTLVGFHIDKSASTQQKKRKVESKKNNIRTKNLFILI